MADQSSSWRGLPTPTPFDPRGGLPRPAPGIQQGPPTQEELSQLSDAFQADFERELRADPRFRAETPQNQQAGAFLYLQQWIRDRGSQHASPAALAVFDEISQGQLGYPTGASPSVPKPAEPDYLGGMLGPVRSIASGALITGPAGLAQAALRPLGLSNAAGLTPEQIASEYAEPVAEAIAGPYRSRGVEMLAGIIPQTLALGAAGRALAGPISTLAPAAAIPANVGAGLAEGAAIGAGSYTAPGEKLPSAGTIASSAVLGGLLRPVGQWVANKARAAAFKATQEKLAQASPEVLAERLTGERPGELLPQARKALGDVETEVGKAYTEAATSVGSTTLDVSEVTKAAQALQAIPNGPVQTTMAFLAASPEKRAVGISRILSGEASSATAQELEDLRRLLGKEVRRAYNAGDTLAAQASQSLIGAIDRTTAGHPQVAEAYGKARRLHASTKGLLSDAGLVEAIRPAAQGGKGLSSEYLAPRIAKAIESSDVGPYLVPTLGAHASRFEPALQAEVLTGLFRRARAGVKPGLAGAERVLDPGAAASQLGSAMTHTGPETILARGGLRETADNIQLALEKLAEFEQRTGASIFRPHITTTTQGATAGGITNMAQLAERMLTPDVVAQIARDPALLKAIQALTGGENVFGNLERLRRYLPSLFAEAAPMTMRSNQEQSEPEPAR